MQSQSFQLYRGILLFNSSILLVLGLWTVAIPEQYISSIEAYSAFNWTEFVFNEPMLGHYILAVFRVLGGFYTCIAIAAGLLTYFALKPDDPGYKSWVWWLVLPLHILPYSILLAFDFYHGTLGAIEMAKMIIWLLSVMAWWRLR